MTHRWLSRALVAVAVPALLVPAIASSANAAPKPPAVPTIDAVAKIYPHVDGGTSDVTRQRKIRMPEKSCKRGAVIKGATGNETYYLPEFDSANDVDATGQEPILGVTAFSFRSAKTASQFLRGSLTEGEDCQAGDEFGDDASMKKIRFRLGNERWGFTVRMGGKRDPILANVLFVRAGAKVLVTTSMSMSGKAAPSIPKTIALARLALKTAR